MKIIFIATSLVIGLFACNDSKTDKSSTTTDTTDHGTHQTDMNNQSTDTSGMAGKSMMSSMQSMMGSMKSMQSTGNPDNDFAGMMKIHHLGAIEMAQLEVAKGNDAQLKQMAQKMLNDQQKEVAELNAFLSGHPPHGGGDAFHKEAMSMMNKMEMPMDHSGSIDKEFAHIMILHHQGAIDMAKAYLKTSSHEVKLKSLANNIITSQEKEKKELKAWLDKNM